MEKEFGVVYYKGEPVYRLNSNLISRQRLTNEGVEEIVKLHEKKLALFDTVRATDEVNELRKYPAILEEIEFAMQKAWGFGYDIDKHEWYKIPKCTCPFLQNVDARYIGGPRIIDFECPLHGG